MDQNNIYRFKRLCLLLSTLMISVPGQSANAGDITGTVTINNSPGADVCVNFYQGTDGCSLSYVSYTTTDSDGTYTMPFTDGAQLYIGTNANCEGVYPEIYDEYWDGSSSSTTGANTCHKLMPVQVPATDIDFDLVPAGTLRGTISDVNGLINSTVYPNTGVSIFTGDACGYYNHLGGTNSNDGNFTIKVPLSGQYLLKTWSNDSNLIEEWYAGATSSQNCGDALPVSFLQGVTEIGGLNFQLEEGGSISGTVSDSSGPINGNENDLRVQVFTGDACGDHYYVKERNLESNGTFAIRGLPLDGQFLLRTYSRSDPAYIEEWYAGVNTETGNPISSQNCSDASNIDFQEANTVGNVNFQLEPGGTITGIVLDSSGPINGDENNVGVQVFTGDACGDHDHVMGRNLESNGTFAIRGLPLDGQFLLRTYSNSDPAYMEEWYAGVSNETGNPISSQNCSDAKTIDFQEANTVGNVNFQLEPGGTITGIVLDSSGPINGDENNVGVQVFTGDACGDHDHVMGRNLESNGTFAIRGLPLDGHFLLRTYSNNNDPAYVEEWFAGWENNNPVSSPNCADAVTVDFTLGNTVGNIDFQIEEGGVIKGTIYEQGAAINGNDNQMGVDIYAGFACDNYQWVASDSIDENGSYAVGGLELNGTYFVKTYIDNAPYQPRWFAGFDISDPQNIIPLMSDNCNEALGLVFEGEAKLIDPIDFDYEKSAVIKGTVIDFDGNPIQGACIRALTQDCGNWNDTTAGESWTDSNGDYTVPVPEERGYYIHVEPGCAQTLNTNLQGYWTGFDPATPVSGNCFDAVKTPLASVQTAVEDIDFELLEGVAITGNVVQKNADDSTQTLGNVCIDFFAESACDDPPWVGGGYSSQNGDYRAVVPMNTTLYAKTNVGCGGYPIIDEYWNDTENQEAYTCGGATQISPMQSGDSAIADFELQQGVVISGTVIDDNDSQPIADVGVSAFTAKCENNSFVNFTRSSDQSEILGEYQLLVPSGIPVYLQTCTNCGSADEKYMDIWYPDASDDNCDNAQPVTAPTSGIDLALPTDTDGDYLSDKDENTIYGTLPDNPDTDGDGIDDGGEVYLWGTDFAGDIDGDGVRNIDETDADNDGVSDLQELARGANRGYFQNPDDTPPPLTLYENFSSSTLDPAKWDGDQYGMEVRGNALQLFANAPYAKKISARLTSIVDDNLKTTFTVTDLHRESTEGQQNLYYSNLGVFYSENEDPTKITGRVYAAIYLGNRGQGMEVWYNIARAIDEDWNDESIEIANDVLLPAESLSQELNTQYSMEVRYDGDNSFTFIFRDSTGNILAETSDTGPTKKSSIDKHLVTRLKTPDTGGRIAVSVDTVYTSSGNDPYTVYDSFSSAPLDSSRWAEPEIGKQVSDGKLRMLAHSYGDRRITYAVLKKRFNYIETRVVFDENGMVSNPSTRSRARLTGTLYNDTYGPDPASNPVIGLPHKGYEGNIWGQILIQYTEDPEAADPKDPGRLAAYAYAERVNDPTWNSYTQLFWEELNITITPGTEYILYIGFAGDLMVFGIDSADGAQHAMMADLIVTPKYLPYNPNMNLQSRVDGNGSEARQMAYFDDVRVSGDPLEIQGDVNVDNGVDLKDAILALQATTGVVDIPTWSTGDVNGDHLIGLPEAIQVMNSLIPAQ